MRQELPYERIVARWKAITSGFIWPESGRCCEVTSNGAPECCFQLVDGEDLTFTAAEIRALALIHGESCEPWRFKPVEGEWRIWRYDRDLLSRGQHTALLKDGWMASTIECASHPLRPIIGEHGHVIGTVMIDACNARLAHRSYVQHRDEITALWQETVDLYGIKPYYVTRSIRKGWTVL